MIKYQIRRIYQHDHYVYIDWWSNSGWGFMNNRMEGSRMSKKEATKILTWLKSGGFEWCYELVKWGK